MKKVLLLLFALIGMTVAAQAQRSEGRTLSGVVVNEAGEALSGAIVSIENSPRRTATNERGEFRFDRVRPGRHHLVVTYVGYGRGNADVAHDANHVRIVMRSDKVLDEAEVFGEPRKRPAKLEAITRIPLRLDEQVQSVSVISHKMIQEQGVQTLADAVRNSPGVGTFATYGGVSESLTARGYRGIPTLKNGVLVQSQMQGVGTLTDMQGVETIQILRGSAAISQGVGNLLGSAGGVVNVATKVPRFINRTEISLTSGSWGQFRPTVDWQTVLNPTTALRFNAAFERRDGFRVHTKKDRVYLNPSLAWNPSKNTSIFLEMDYLHDSRTPDQGTVNLSADSVENIYKMPNNKFMGFSTDNRTTNNTTYSARLLHELGKGYSIRLALSGSHLGVKSLGGFARALSSSSSTGEYNLRRRTYGGSERADNNVVFQADFTGKDIYTGSIRHTFTVGFDYTANKTYTVSTNTVTVDTINVLSTIDNELPSGISLTNGTPSNSRSYTYGILAQEVMTFNRYIKLSLGLRYSHVSGTNNNAIATATGNAWDPLVGVIVTPFKDFNIFASYTHTSSLRQSANVDSLGNSIGTSRDIQFEAGIKAEFFNNRLRFNLTLFHIKNSNIAYSALDDNGNSLGYYIKAGNLTRKGIEAELTGRVLRNMDVVLGYSYLDAAYHDSPYYHEGSAPMNTANNMANGWVNYIVDRGSLKGLGFGVGAYYVGKRPLAEYTYTVLAGHQVQANTPPFKAPAFTTVNVQASYRYKKYTLRAFLNNVFNSIGYSAYYRGGYLNQTDPRNFAVSLSYTF